MYVWVFAENHRHSSRVFSQHFGNMTQPLELGIFASFYTKMGKNTLVGWSPRVVPFMKILSDSWAKSSHILQNSPPLLHCSTTSCIYVHILMT